MKKTKDEAEITKNLIIEKAVELFKLQGFASTTLEEIAQQAKVTRGAIYWHFKDKLDIVDDLVETEHQKLSQLLKDLFNEDLPPYTKLEKIITGIVKNFFTHKSFRNFIDLTWFKIEYTQLSKLKTTKAELNTYFINNLKILINEAQIIGDINAEVSAQDVALTLTNMINGMYRLFFILPDQINRQKAALQLFQSYLRLIKS
jgi:TetR/AcrR family acrAB operon transcriptional repressor